MVIPWVIPAALAAALVLLLIRILGPRLFRGTLMSRYAFRCPVKEQDVATEFRESVWDGRRLDVERCSAVPSAPGAASVRVWEVMSRGRGPRVG